MSKVVSGTFSKGQKGIISFLSFSKVVKALLVVSGSFTFSLNVSVKTRKPKKEEFSHISQPY